MRKKYLFESRLNYYDGQLLMKDDFLGEQSYHLNARCRHNLRLHGSGVVEGLEVTRGSESTVLVSPGYAIDQHGRDIYLDQSQSLELTSFGPNDVLRISFCYEEERSAHGTVEHNRLDCYAVVLAERVADQPSGITLASVTLSNSGKVTSNSIDSAKRQFARTVLAPESVTGIALQKELRTGWWRSPPRLMKLINKPEGVEEMPPEFRVGATTAISPDPRDAGDKDRGAGGTMAIPIPPLYARVVALRIAGEENRGELRLQLLSGQWDPKKNNFTRSTLIEEIIGSESPFMKTYDIQDGGLNPENDTLAFWVYGTRRTSISLVAVRFEF